MRQLVGKTNQVSGGVPITQSIHDNGKGDIIINILKIIVKTANQRQSYWILTTK